MCEPIVSVVIPVYNAEATLAACVGSVIEQSLTEIEIILVDDGSTDRSGAMCDAFAEADPRVQAVHQPCDGVSSARNAGLARAKGLYTAFLDSDDRMLPGALAAAVQAQRADPGAWVLWHYSTGDENERFEAGCVRRPICDLARLYTDCLLSMPWNKLYLTATARAVGFDENYTLGEDLLFCLAYRRALHLTQVCVLGQPCTFYNCGQSDGTLSTRYLPDYCAVWEGVFEQLNRSMQECGCPQADVEAVWRAELQVLAEGAADILRRDPAAPRERLQKARAALRAPWVTQHLQRMRAEQVYSPYYRPVKNGAARQLLRMAQSRAQGTAYFGHMDWLGYYLLGGGWKRG